MAKSRIPLYEKLYLIQVGSGGKEVLVSLGDWRAEPRIDPAYVRFFPTERTSDGETIGTLILDEDVWEEWYTNPPDPAKKRDMLPGFETAMSAATNMVKQSADIYFGCPFCLFRTKDVDKYWEHVDNHSLTILKMFSPSRVREALKEEK